MKSYSKLNPYYKGLVPGMLVNSSEPPGPGWVEVTPKVTCPECPSCPDPIDPGPPDVVMMPSQLIPTDDVPKLRIISTTLDGTTIYTDYMINVFAMTKAQLQTYLDTYLGSWGYWSTLDNTPAIVPFIKKRVTAVQVYQKNAVIVFPTEGT
jgi:hypothetical protein